MAAAAGRHPFDLEHNSILERSRRSGPSKRKKNRMRKLSLIGTVLTGAALATSAIAAEAGNALRVGAAKVDVTKWSNAPISATAKYDQERVNVRAIVVDNGATRAALISIPGSSSYDWPAISKLVTAELNCPVENILISGTHSHSFRPVPAPNASSPAPLTQAVLDAVRLAKGKLQPARMGFGSGKSFLNVNRDTIYPEPRRWAQYTNLDAPSDKTVAVLKFETAAGELMAAYVNYAMHPINGYVLNITNGDYPESMSRYVEKAFGDNIVVAFSQGAAGDQEPLHLRPSNNAMASRAGNKITGYEIDREASEGPLRVNDSNGKPVITKPADPKVLDDMYRFIESEGQILGEEVIRVMTWTKGMTGSARIWGAQKALPCPARKRTNGDAIDPKTREGIEGVYVDTPPVEIPMGVLAIGTVALAPIGGEVYSLIGEKLKAAAPLTRTIFVTSANQQANVGYIPDDGSYGHLTFQVLNTRIKQGCAEPGIVKTVEDLETQYLTAR